MVKQGLSPYFIKTTFVKYEQVPGGKYRPILIHKSTHWFYLWNITSKFLSKSNQIKKQYFPLFHWRLYGLNQPSYVDAGSVSRLPIPIYGQLELSKKPVICNLSEYDALQFTKFFKRFEKLRTRSS